MNVLSVYGAEFRKLLLALLFCCALLGIGVGTVAEIKPDHFAAALFAQDTDESQPESPLPPPLESAAAQPESPLAEPESKSNEEAADQPESPLKKPELTTTEEPTDVPSKTPEPTATIVLPTATATFTVEPTATAEPTATPEPTATTEPTSIPEPTATVALTETTVLSSTGDISSTQVTLLPGPGQAESIPGSGEQEIGQFVTEPTGTQTLNAAPVAVAELLGLLGSTGTRPFLLTENLILALLCLIAFSVMWLGICALSVCLFYIRSRQSNQINDYARSDRHMIVHYRR